jgi:serine/threonine-protein kinase
MSADTSDGVRTASLAGDAAGESGVEVGSVIDGKYRVDGVLGEGGMGLVLAATHLRMNQAVAIKIATRAGSIAARLVREAQFVAQLQSQHIVRVLDVSLLPDGRPFLVLERLEGRSLAALVEAGPMEPARAVALVLQAIEGVAEAHGVGLVHRDLKPSNLFVATQPDGTELVKVLDFGIAKAGVTEGDATLTGSAGFVGSSSYASPEQIRHARDADARADVWSLGVTLYELLSTRRPFEAETASGVMAAIVADAAIPLERVASGVPRALAAVVERCLEKDREKRFGDVAALARALAPFGPSDASARVDKIVRLLGPRARPAAADPPAKRADDATAGAHVVQNAPGVARSKAVVVGVSVAVALSVASFVLLRRSSAPDSVALPAAVIATTAEPIASNRSPDAIGPSPAPPPSAASASPTLTASAAPAPSPRAISVRRSPIARPATLDPPPSPLDERKF